MNAEEIKKIIESITENAKNVVSLQQNLKLENNHLKKENEALKGVVDTLNTRINALKEELEAVRCLKVLETGSGDKDVRNKLNEMIRAVDKCIDSLKP